MSYANRALSAWKSAEASRDWRYPLSRWYLRPLACRLAVALDASHVRPWMVTVLGFACVVAGAALFAWEPAYGPSAGLLVMLGWLCDRADGVLARRQHSASAWGAWLDANLDELGDVAIHSAIALAWTQSRPGAPLVWLAAHLSGKYLFMYGLHQEEHLAEQVAPVAENTAKVAANAPPQWRRWLAGMYHGPANADLRIHCLAASLLTGCSGIWLAGSAVYYHARWIVRYVLVAQRLARKGASP